MQGYFMKKPVNLRLDENIIVTLNQLANELNTTKTEVVERALKLFSKTKQKERNQLLEFAGILKNHEANKMLNDIQTNKNSKDFEINL
jgi:predicted transcriptional regulator